MTVFGKDLVPGIYKGAAGLLLLRAVREDEDGYSLYIDYDYDGSMQRNYLTTRNTAWSMEPVDYVIDEIGLP